jgi:hypothetical protein
MCDCYWFNGDSCTYDDYATGQSEDGYCNFEYDDDEENDCDSYSPRDEDEEEE